MTYNMGAETVVNRAECRACRGSGVYKSLTKDRQPIIVDCECCGGTGTVDPMTQRSTLQELGARITAEPTYISGE